MLIQASGEAGTAGGPRKQEDLIGLLNPTGRPLRITATRAGDTEGESAARSRVDAAKIALGERGPEWWSQSDDERRARRTDGLRCAADEGFHPRDTDV